MALTDGLVAYYKLDGNSNDVFGNNGTDTNVTYSAANGKLIQGAGFNSTGYIATSLYIKSPAVVSAISFSFWINQTAGTNYNHIITYGSNASVNAEFILWFNTGKVRYFRRSDNLGIEDTVSIVGQGWQHFVGTNDGTTLTLYKNGAYVGQQTAANNVQATDYPIRIGQRESSNVTGMQGNLDEVGIWNRVLSADEVKDLYLNGNGSQYPFRDKMFF